MAYNTKEIVKDKDGNPISQYYNPTLDKYEPLEGVSGANKVTMVDNPLSLVPILETLERLTGTVIDEDDRKQHESERIDNESFRKSNENDRIENENIRKDNEVDRVNKESTRVKNENDRLSKESTRVSKESTRRKNENIRISNEDDRKSAESTRLDNEINRVSKESVRNSNEFTRISNEENRQSKIKEFEIWEPYDRGKIYNPLNKVYYNGGSYVNIKRGIGKTPTNSSYWLKVAVKGDKGDRGDSGFISDLEGKFALKIKSDGNLWVKYEDGTTPPDMYINNNGELIYNIN